VLVMVSGLVQTKEYSHQRKFIQMFFLAPQEKGYFVLNDYFHFVDQEQVQPAPVIAQENFESNLASNTVVETGMHFSSETLYQEFKNFEFGSLHIHLITLCVHYSTLLHVI
jgi:hypothetical protein